MSEITRPKTAAVRSAAIALGTAGVVALLLLIALGVTRLADLSEHQRIASQAARDDRELLISCNVAPDEREPPVVNPDPDDCYLRRERRTAQILGEPPAPVNPTVIAASACANKFPGDYRATEKCVVRLLHAEKILKDKEQP